MNRSFYSLGVAIIFCMGMMQPNTAHAYINTAPGAGAELLYEWLSDSTYRIFLKYYHDCSSADTMPTTVSMCYYNSCNSINGSITLDSIFTPDKYGVTNSNYCRADNKCTNPYSVIPGYQEQWYVNTITLTGRCDYWTFYVNLPGRNGSQNLAGINKMYIEATLDNLNAQGNTSPFFAVKLIPFICEGMPYTYNNEMYDRNNDSLFYEMIPTRAAVHTNCQPAYDGRDIPLLGGYNLTDNPFATNNTFVLNHSNGFMNFTLADTEANAISLRVNEYRGGKKIGSVMRDIQIIGVKCYLEDYIIRADSTKLTNGHVWAQVGQPLHFCFDMSRIYSASKIVMQDNANTALPGATVAYIGLGTPQAEGCLSWTPTQADLGLKNLTITLKDTSCLPPFIVLTHAYTIPIEVCLFPAGVANIAVTADAITVYPNPANSVVYVKSPTLVNATIVSMDGRVVLHSTNATNIDISMLPAGIDVLRITDMAGKLMKVEKLVKEK